MTVRRTRPPAIVAWTSEIGASASAPTWNPQPTVAVTIPSVYQGFLKSANEVRSGFRYVHLGHRDRSAVLVEETEHGRERRREREQQADLDGDGHGRTRLREGRWAFGLRMPSQEPS